MFAFKKQHAIISEIPGETLYLIEEKGPEKGNFLNNFHNAHQLSNTISVTQMTYSVCVWRVETVVLFHISQFDVV